MPDAPLSPRPAPGRARPWLRGAGAVILLALVAAVAIPVLPRSVTSPLRRTFAPRLPAPLGAYPDVESLGRVAREQLAGPKPAYPKLVWASRSFRGETNGWEWMRLAPDGRKETGRDLWSYALQGGSAPYFGERFDPRPVQALLDRLGPSVTPPPPIDRALFVSFHRDGHWTTRLYDRTAPPRPLIDAETLVNGELRKSRESSWTLRPIERLSGR